jgi:hypothetical protein
LRASLAISPAIAEVHNELGLVVQAQGRLDEAISAYRTALSINAGLAAAHFNLGRALQSQGDQKAAADCYRRFLAIEPGYFQAHHNLGIALEAVGDLTGAVAAYKEAFALKPTFYASLFGETKALTRLVPLWHVPMMNDAQRNDAYFAGLRAAITPRSRVFEIGTGAGLLSLMAARLGAEEVTTCEAEPLVAETARQIVAANGFEGKVRVLAKKSTEVNLGGDLARPADVLVQEVFSSNLLSEEVLSSIEDAKRRLLAPDCRMVPAAASIMIALFGGDEIGKNLVMTEEVHGFDLRGFNRIVPRIRSLHRKDLQVDFLSEEIEAFRFDFQHDSTWRPEEKTLRLKVVGDGHCLGILQWIRLYFGDNAVFENHPKVRSVATGWPACAYLNQSPAAVLRGQMATVFASHDRTQPWFELQSAR